MSILVGATSHTWTSSTALPVNGIGSRSDIWIYTPTNDYYKYTGSIWNKAGNFQAVVDAVTGGGAMTLTGVNDETTVLTVKGSGNQSASIFEVRDANANVLFAIGNEGLIRAALKVDAGTVGSGLQGGIQITSQDGTVHGCIPVYNLND